MFTSKEIEEFSKQANIRENDFIIILDTLQQNGFSFKQKNTSSNNCTILESYLIGQGSQSHVFLGENTQNGKEVALKFQNCSQQAYQDMIQKVQTFENKNNFIVNVYEHFYFEQQQLCIQIVELCQKSLKDEIHEMKLKNTQFSVDQIIKIFLFSINALLEIHSNDIIHCNIKPTNILLSKDGQYKLSDFGVSMNNKLHNIHILSKEQGTNYYLSPEQLQNIENAENGKEIIKMKQSTDIYSMGVTLLEILGVTLNKKIQNDSKLNNYSEIRKQINCDLHNFYAFVENFMLQKEEKNRYFAFRIRLQFIDYFESIFPFQEEQIRVSEKIKQYESCKKNKYLAFLYFYLSQTIQRNEDCSLIEKSLQIMKDLNLSETFEISIFYEHYSQILNNVQKYEESNNYLILSGDIKKSLFQNVHLEVAHNLSLQSNNSKMLGKFQEMLDQSQKSLEILEIIYEKQNNPDIARSLNRIGSAFQSLGDVQKGLQYYYKALQMREELFSGNHPDIAWSLNNVGSAYYSLGDFQKALEYHLKTLQMLETLLPENHPDIAWSLNNAGYSYDSLGDSQKGLEYQLKSLQMYQTFFSGNHPDIASSLNGVGCAYDSLGDAQQALEYYQKALQMRETLFTGNHPDIASSLNNVGCAYDSLGDIQKGLEYYLKSLNIRKALFSGNHPDIASSLYNIGCQYNSLGDSQRALIYHLKSLQMYQSLFSGNNSDIAWSLNNVGCVYDSLGDLQRALKYYQQAIQMFSALQKQSKVQQLQQRVSKLKQKI